MTPENKETQEVPPLCELLIEFGTKHGVENKLQLPELVGHYEIASREIFNRQILAAQQAQAERQAQNQPVEPVEGDDTEEPVAFSPGEDEDKDEK